MNGYELCVHSHRQKVREADPLALIFLGAATRKAAEEGLGVAMGLFPVTNRSLKEGRLVALTPNHHPIEDSLLFGEKTQ